MPLWAHQPPPAPPALTTPRAPGMVRMGLGFRASCATGMGCSATLSARARSAASSTQVQQPPLGRRARAGQWHTCGRTDADCPPQQSGHCQNILPFVLSRPAAARACEGRGTGNARKDTSRKTSTGSSPKLGHQWQPQHARLVISMHNQLRTSIWTPPRLRVVLNNYCRAGPHITMQRMVGVHQAAYLC
jgi:hypothetical protein